MIFGERLSLLRKNKKLSQQELANRLNISKSSLAMYETNKREPNFETVDRLATYFEVTTDYLLGRSNYPTLDQSSSDFADKHGIFESKDEEREFSMDYESWTEEEKEEMREFVRFKMEQRKKKQQKSDK